MTNLVPASRRRRNTLLVVAAAVGQLVLPAVLARAVRRSADRDCADCHEASTDASHAAA